MPYARPTLTDLRNQALQDLAAAQVTDSNGNVLTGTLPRAILRVLLIAQAGQAYEHYGYLDWIAQQAVPWSAEGEYLEGWAALVRVYREQATATTASLTFTGTTGIPAGTIVVRGDGLTFAASADGVIGTSTTVVNVWALTAGSAGNFDAGTLFQLQTPIYGMLANSVASTQTSAGADQETDDSLRSRMLSTYANPPQGGDRADYVNWARSVPGVTRAWVTPNGNGSGTVVLYVMLDNAESANGGFPVGTNGISSLDGRDTAATGDQLTVANALYPNQPVTALVYVCAPVAQPVNFLVTDLGVNNTAAMLASIQTALTDMFLRLGQVGGTIDPTTNAVWAGIEPDAWYAALEAIPGLTGFKVSSPAVRLTPTTGAILTLGTVTTSS